MNIADKAVKTDASLVRRSEWCHASINTAIINKKSLLSKINWNNRFWTKKFNNIDTHFAFKRLFREEVACSGNILSKTEPHWKTA
jgi:hypothetical protein